jgi:2-iminobutanoate/2-iminopropanoate deaminase
VPRSRRNVRTRGALGSYSSAVVAGEFCFVSGQAALDEAGNKLFGGITEQTEATIENLRKVLGAAGYRLNEVVKVTCYLSDMADWSEMDRVFATFFRESPPARATIEAELIYDCLVEMDCVAWKPG